MCQGLTISKLSCRNPSEKYHGFCFQHKKQAHNQNLEIENNNLKKVNLKLSKKLNIANDVIDTLGDEISYLKMEVRNSVPLSKFRDINENKNLVTDFNYFGANYQYITFRKDYIDSIFMKNFLYDNLIKNYKLEIESLKNRPKSTTFFKKQPNDKYQIIKKENESLKEAVDTLKKRIQVHSELSKISYKYEILDTFINKTVEENTGRIRDYGAGIYNKITDFMRIRNISKICIDTLGITSEEFYKQFISLRNTRNETCHPRLKNRDLKNISKVIVQYINSRE